jgi:hypothetical protein
VNTHFESLGRVRLQGTLLLAVVFVIGGLTGAALERSRAVRPGPPPPVGQGLPPGWRQELSLSDEQDRRIHEIFENNRPRTDAILDEFLPRLRGVADSVRVMVRMVLTPDQQKLFDRLQPPLEPPARDGRPPFGGPPPGGPGGNPPPAGPPQGGPGGPAPDGPPPGGPRPGGPPPPGGWR